MTAIFNNGCQLLNPSCVLVKSYSEMVNEWLIVETRPTDVTAKDFAKQNETFDDFCNY